MMEKSALAGEGGGVRHPPFQPITIMYKVTLPVSPLPYVTLCSNKKAEITELFYNGKKNDCPELGGQI